MSEQENEIVLGEFVGLMKTTNHYKTIATGYVEATSSNKVLNEEFFARLADNHQVFAGLFLNAPWLWDSAEQRQNAFYYVNHTLHSTNKNLVTVLEGLNYELPENAYHKWTGFLNDGNVRPSKKFETWGKGFVFRFFMKIKNSDDGWDKAIFFNNENFGGIRYKKNGHIKFELKDEEIDVQIPNTIKNELVEFVIQQQPSMGNPDEYILRGLANGIERMKVTRPSDEVKEHRDITIRINDNMKVNKAELYDLSVSFFPSGKYEISILCFI